MDIFDQKNKENFMNIFGFIDGHFWRKKTKTFMSKHCFTPMPIAHLHCAKFGFIGYKNQVWEFGDKSPLILIPGYLI